MLYLIGLIGIAAGLFILFKKEHKKPEIKETAHSDLWRDAYSGEPQKIIAQPTTREKESLAYRRHRYILTKAERSFYGVLQAATQENYEVFIKIRIADVLKPAQANRSEWQSAFNKIAHKHFDFVICKKHTLQIIAAIELNDKSHDSADRKERDEFVRTACKSAGLPLVCIKAASGYNIERTRQLIQLIEKSNDKFAKAS